MPVDVYSKIISNFCMNFVLSFGSFESHFKDLSTRARFAEDFLHFVESYFFKRSFEAIYSDLAILPVKDLSQIEIEISGDLGIKGDKGGQKSDSEKEIGERGAQSLDTSRNVGAKMKVGFYSIFVKPIES